MRSELVNLLFDFDSFAFNDACGNIPTKLQTAYDQFRAFCKTLKETPMVKHFTKDNLSWSGSKFPEASFKGSDVRLLLRFLIDFLERQSTTLDEVSTAGYIAAKSMQDFLSLVFSNKRWFLARGEAWTCWTFLNLWLEKVYFCAKKCYEKIVLVQFDAQDALLGSCRFRPGEATSNCRA